MMNTAKRIFVISIAVLASFSSVAVKASAESIVISDNGSGSENEVAVSSTQDVSVSQDNNASVTNDVSIEANTGGNSASNNTTGETNIQTGDTAVQTAITTNVNNSGVSTTTCCPANGSNGGGKSVISGNGSHSTNNISANNTNSVAAQVTNNSSITNTINGYANTGGNIANNNSGDVFIKTGSITVKEKIKNLGNTSYVDLGLPLGNDFMAKIDGNGIRSENDIDLTNTNDIVVAVNNNADIFNNSFWDLVTGENEANDNSGDVSIETGDINYQSEIINDVNKSLVVVSCCEKEKEKPQPITPPEKPVTPNHGGGNGSGGGSNPSKDEVQSAMQEVLPVTGNMWFFLALAANIAMLIFGTYMRLRSGRSPGAIVA